MPFKIKKTVSSLAPSGNSVLFNGTNQNLRIANNAALQFGTGDFTVDFWLYGNTSQVAYARALSIGGTYGGSQIGLEVDIQGSSGLIMEVNSGASTVTSIVIYAPSTWKNQWNHIAVTRVGTTFYAFYNGTLAGSVTPASINLIGTDGVSIGCSTANANYWNGYISNLRLVKGTGLYTASFTPPTAPLTAISGTSLLVCQSPTIVDNSTNNFAITNNNAATVSSAVTPFTAPQSVFKIKKNNPNPTMLTGYGASFNGSNQYLSLPNTSALDLGSNNFTMEAWVYPTSVSGNKNIFYINGNASSYSAICLYIQDSKFAFLANQTGGYPWTLQIGAVGPTISSNTWYHVAATRSGNSFYVFVNGTLVSGAPYSLSGALFNGTTNSIGYQASMTSNNFPGYISNARIINGTALYTASFAPPTSPLTAITSCSLLTCNAATIVDASTKNLTITNNNSVVASSSFTPFSSSLIAPTNYSVAFNGSSTWLTTPSTSSLAIGTGDFTYECWAYLSSTPGQYNSNAMSSFVQNSAGDHGTYIGFTSALTAFATLKLDNSTSLTLNSGATTYALNTWHHVVLSRVGTTVSLFFNGSRVATNTNSYNLIENIVAIGKQYATTESGVNGFTNVGVFNGYISNARVIIGGTQPYSPTSTTLTVPTTPISAITNTKLLTCNAATIVDSSTNNLTLTNTGTATVSSTITPFSASVSNGGFKLKQVSYVRPTYNFTISPAYSGKSTWDLVTDGPLILSTSGSWIITPTTSINTKIKMWGGGGASFKAAWKGGGGGFSSGSVQLESGVSYGIVTSMNGSNGIIGSGGLTGIFSSSISQANSIMIAGGGGVGTDYLGNYGGNGGAGGGSSGQDGTGDGLQNGRGGTQIAGGSPAVYNSQKAGSALQANGGDGGAGYWGGGAQNAAGSGGGSGYIHPTKVTSGITVTGASSTPANSSDSDRAGSGQGSLGNTSGSMGIIIIRAA